MRSPLAAPAAVPGWTLGSVVVLSDGFWNRQFGRDPQVLGRTLPLNGAGVCGAVLADLGLPLAMLRGFALLARTAGLLGQLAEEQRMPIANEIYMHVDRNADQLLLRLGELRHERQQLHRDQRSHEHQLHAAIR